MMREIERRYQLNKIILEIVIVIEVGPVIGVIGEKE